jgi:hypothetical protein
MPSPATSPALLRYAVDEACSWDVRASASTMTVGKARRAVGALDLGDRGRVQPRVPREVFLETSRAQRAAP